ncbi:MAG TPA: D-alanyl-D-alanine carboxypeptidase family protein [Chloroflexia bacterium]|nr:D-alanyl-D-alanine carboxypeptidase family protein [Chloroflexia bacterium]
MFFRSFTHASLDPTARRRPIHRLFTTLLAVALVALGFAPVVAHSTPLGQTIEEPEIGARAAIVVEYPSGRILYTKRAHDQLAPASTTKILTAILALEYGKLDDLVAIMPDDLVGESTMGLQNGEKQTMHDLLYGLMLPSGNDAAMAIARTLGSRVVAGEVALKPPVARFAEMMNVRVGQLGLTDSHFVNPSGLDADGHYSSAYDLASLSWYALHIPEFNEIVRNVSYEAPGHPLLNTNELLTRYEGADGIKTGLTDNAGLCLVGSATRDGHRLISVVLNAPQWYADTAAILDYSYALLAADPVGLGAEQLSVSNRGAVSWLLGKAGDGAAPPMPLLSPGAQGGGAPDIPVQPKPGLVDTSNGNGAISGGGPPPVIGSAGRADGIVPWTLAIFALGGLFLLYKFAVTLGRVRPGHLLARLLPARIRPAATATVHSYSAPRQPREITRPHHSRRREPNLLLSSHEQREMHLERAIDLASQEREGSSMAEFLMALRYGDLDVAELASEYRLPPAAFLALARAQLALSRHEDARRTLIHGVTVLPNHRPLRMALHQYTR